MVVGDVTTAVDLLVLGAGPAGYVAAIRAAQLGRHVTLVEPGPLGGTCLHRGCIPLKALGSASERYRQAQGEELAALGIHVASVSCDWSRMQSWKQGVVTRLADGVSRLVAGNRIECVKGTGWFLNGQEVRVEGEETSHRFKFTDCIIAVGAHYAASEQAPFDGEHILTPEQALALPELPAALTVLGDDYIALELAALFARLGVNVRLCTPGDQLLPDVDPVALRLVQAGLRKLGIETRSRVSLAALSARPIVISQTVRPRTAGLHLAEAGVEVDEDGHIVVNTMMQTNAPHIYAIGDCAGNTIRLASVALKQGKVAAEVACGTHVQFAPLVIPLVVHTTPELATVGYSAQTAAQAGYPVVTGRFPLAANGRALTLGAENGVALLVAHADSGTLLGATLVGPHAGDLIGQAALAIEMGATLTDLAEILYAHPGLSETLQESAEQALERSVHILAKP